MGQEERKIISSRPKAEMDFGITSSAALNGDLHVRRLFTRGAARAGG